MNHEVIEGGDETGQNRLLTVAAACTLACACALAGTSVVAPADSARQPTAGSGADVAPQHQCRAGHKPPFGPQQVLRTVPGATNEVALTFDMGGRLEPALSILQFLADQQVCATIFLTGAISQTPAGQEVLAFIRARPHLFEVGNHTMHHCNFRDGGGGSPTTAPCPTTRPSSTFVQRELTDAAAVIRQGTGQDPVPYWRPPYGTYDQPVADAAAAVGYSSTLLWSIDTIDWKPVSEGGPTAQQIVDKVLAGAAPGSIVLFHLGGWNTRDALPLIVPRLRERGFRLTAISDILAAASGRV